MAGPGVPGFRGRGAGRAPDPPPDDTGWTREVVEASPDGVVLVDADGTVVYVNPAVTSLTGWSRDRLEGQGLGMLVPEGRREAHERLRRAFEQAPRSRAMGPDLHLEMRRADGTGLPVEIALAPVTVSGRRMTIATVRDVSARRADEAERARLGHLLDLVPDSVVVVDLETQRVTDVNRAASSLFGHPREELLGMPVARLQPPPEPGGAPDPATEPPERVLLTDGEMLHPVRVRRRDGSVVDAEIHATTVEGPGESRQLVNVVRDVHDRATLERRVRESEESFRTVFEQVPVGIAITRVDAAGRRTLMRTNEAFTAMFGYPPGGLDGRDPAVLRPTVDTRDGKVTRLVVSGELVDHTVTRRYTRRDGSGVWAEARATLVRLAGETDTLYLVRALDVTTRFDAELAARRQAQVTECVADVARAALEHRPEAVVFERIAAGAQEVLDAHSAAVLLAEDGFAPRHGWGAVVGRMAEPLMAALEADTEGLLVDRLVPTTAAALDGPPAGTPEPLASRAGPMVIAPFGRVGSPPHGGLLACRAPGAPGFDADDVERLVRLATQTQVALHLSRARADQQRLALLEERQRIARELHDTVIQDVIAVGMQISADVDAEADPLRQEHDLEKVARLESATRNLRRAVFELRGTSRRVSTATEATEIVTESARILGHFPTVTFTGPVDELPDPVAEDLLAVLREALANVARHAAAQQTSVRVAVDEDTVTLTVDDDGVGPPEHVHTGYGLGYVEDRARRHGGHVLLAQGPVIGSRLTWTCPTGVGPRR